LNPAKFPCPTSATWHSFSSLSHQWNRQFSSLSHQRTSTSRWMKSKVQQPLADGTCRPSSNQAQWRCGTCLHALIRARAKATCASAARNVRVLCPRQSRFPAAVPEDCAWDSRGILCLSTASDSAHHHRSCISLDSTVVLLRFHVFALPFVPAKMATIIMMMMVNYFSEICATGPASVREWNPGKVIFLWRPGRIQWHFSRRNQFVSKSI
jgi:hypothetical protein